MGSEALACSKVSGVGVFAHSTTKTEKNESMRSSTVVPWNQDCKSLHNAKIKFHVGTALSACTTLVQKQMNNFGFRLTFHIQCSSIRLKPSFQKSKWVLQVFLLFHLAWALLAGLPKPCLFIGQASLWRMAALMSLASFQERLPYGPLQQFTLPLFRLMASLFRKLKMIWYNCPYSFFPLVHSLIKHIFGVLW